MNFWESEIGMVTGSSEDAFAKDFGKLVPDGTLATAVVTGCTNQEYNGNKYIQVDWELTDGEYKGQKLRQKIKVFEQDPKKRHRALNMLKLMYVLFKITPKHKDAPTDADLAAFKGHFAGIKIRETEPTAEIRGHNWVSEVHSTQGFKCETGIKLVVTHSNVADNSAVFESAFERNKEFQSAKNDIPF